MENEDEGNNARAFLFLGEILEQIPEGNENEMDEEEEEYQHEEVEEEEDQQEVNEQEVEEEEDAEVEQQEYVPNALAQHFDEFLLPPPHPEEEEEEYGDEDTYTLAQLFRELTLDDEENETEEVEEESGEEEEECEEEDTYEFDLALRSEEEDEEEVLEEEDGDIYDLSQLFYEFIEEEEEVNEEVQEEAPQENDEQDPRALVQQFNELFLLPPPAPPLSAEEVDAFYATHPLPNLPHWILADATAEIARQDPNGNEHPINAMDVIRRASEEAARYYRSFAETERAREMGFYDVFERNVRRVVIPDIPHCSHQHPQLIIQRVPRPQQRLPVYTAAAFGGGDAPISEREFFANLPLPPLPEGARPAPRDIGDHIFPDEDESDESPRDEENEVEEEEALQYAALDSPEAALSPRFEVAAVASKNDQKSPRSEKKTE